MKIRMALCGGVAALNICAGTVVAAQPSDTSDEAARLQLVLDGVHEAGVPGAFALVRDLGRTWRGASGVADVATGRPVTADMLHRVGSITETFTAAAILQQVDEGRIRLDAPIADYLPDMVPGERGQKITIRMLLNHTSNIPDHIRYAFPSLQVPSPKSVDDNRFRHFSRAELIELGLSAPPAGVLGATPGVCANANYLFLYELLVKGDRRAGRGLHRRERGPAGGPEAHLLPDGHAHHGPARPDVGVAVGSDRPAARGRHRHHVVGGRHSRPGVHHEPPSTASTADCPTHRSSAARRWRRCNARLS